MSTESSPPAEVPTEDAVAERPSSGNVRLPQDDVQNPELPLDDLDEETAGCRNCGASLQGTFCHDCGQRHRTGQITFGDLGRHLVDSVFDLKRGFLYTLRRIALNPGDVARRYVRGERKTFTNPLTMFLLVATAVFFVLGFYKSELVSMMAEITKVSVPDAAFEEEGDLRKVFGITSRQEYGELIFFVMQRVYSYIGIFYCFLIALALRLFFSQRTIAENVVFQLYTFTQINLWGILSCVVTLGFLGAPSLYITLSFGVMLVLQILAGRSYWGKSLKEVLLNTFGFLIGYLGTFISMTVIGGLIGIGYALLS